MNDDKFYEKYFEEYLHLYPTMNDYLNYSKMSYLKKYFENSISKEHLAKSKKFYLKYKKNLANRIKAKGGIKNATYYDKVLKYEIDNTLEGFKYPLEYIPIDQMNNTITNYMEWIQGTGLYIFDKHQDYVDFIHKTHDFSKLCYQMITNMRIGIRKGYVIPKEICQMTINDIRAGLKMKSYINNKVPADLQGKWDKMIANDFLVPVNAVVEFMENEYLPKCRKTIGYYALPNGKELYRFIVKSFTTLNKMTVDEVHKIGLSEVSRIYKEMNKVRIQYKFKGTQKAFNEFLKTNPSLHFNNDKTLMGAYKEKQNYIMKNIIPKNFEIMPNYNYLIKKVPKFMEDSQSAAYYWSGNIEGKRKGTFYINLREIKSMAKMDVEVLSLHEGNPGHHFQQTIMMQDPKIPMFIKASDYTSFVEGWGLYSENLGEYKDVLSYYGKLNFEMMRSVRLVVDTGIHYYGWSVEKCRKYFQKYTSLPMSEIDAEIYRYIAMPGQALGYKIGELTILKLREKFLKKGGDIKKFHTKVLEHGNAPLEILMELFDD